MNNIKSQYKKTDILGDMQENAIAFANRVNGQLSKDLKTKSVLSLIDNTVNAQDSEPELTEISYVTTWDTRDAVFTLLQHFILDSSPVDFDTFERTEYRMSCTFSSRIPLRIELAHFIQMDEPPIGVKLFRRRDGDVILYCNFPTIQEVLATCGGLRFIAKSVKQGFDCLSSQYLATHTLEDGSQQTFVESGIDGETFKDQIQELSIGEYADLGNVYNVTLSYDLREFQELHHIEGINLDKHMYSYWEILSEIYYTLEDLGIIISKEKI